MIRCSPPIARLTPTIPRIARRWTAKEWEKAIEREVVNLRSHDAIEPTLEDTLPTWDPVRKVAREVAGLLHVLKKNYIDGVFDK